MADLEEMTPGEVLADSSVAEFIKELGLGIAAAQAALDDNSVRQMELFTTRRDDLGGRSLLDLGLMPSFYHYQHADITCSMQLRLEVGKSDEFGFGVRAGINDESSSSRSTEEEESSSSTTERTEHRTAELTMRADSQGALSIEGGQSLTATGTTPLQRLRSLQSQIVEADGDISALIFEPPDTKPEMSLQTPTDKVVVDSPTVAFLRADFNSAVIRIGADIDTDYVVNGSLTVNTTAQGDLDAYAAHVVEQFTAAGYQIQHARPGMRILFSVHFDPESHSVGDIDGELEDLSKTAGFLRGTGLSTKIEGATDRTASRAFNLRLGERRADATLAHLRSHGVPGTQLGFENPKSRGETAAEEAGDADGVANQEFRVAWIRTEPVTEHWLFVKNGPDFDPASVAPDGRTGGSGGPDNAYVYLHNPEPLGLSGNGVEIDGTTFGFSGAAVTGGPAAGTAAAHAENLTRAINATTTHRAWRTGNVVRVARSGDQFSIQLFSTSSRQLRVAESSDFTVTEQFTESRRAVESTNKDDKRTIAVGVTVDARFSRQFNMEVTGNSSISARLVSVPAPTEFLDEIQAYQNGLER